MYSIVIPVYNEIDSIESLYREIVAVGKNLSLHYEIIFLDDGSRDGSCKKLCEIKNKDANVKVISFARNYGKSVVYTTGFALAKGEYIITMDSDLQDDPNEIPKFIEKINSGYDVVVGWKKNRFQNEPLKKIPSLCYNFLKQFFFGIRLRDSNCGFRMLRKESVQILHLYGDRYRFIPELSHINGFKVCEIPINHRKRTYGRSKYGFSRFFTGFFDILSVRFLSSYHFKPLHFFGSISLIPITIGFVLECYVVWQKIGNGSTFQKHVAAIIIGVMMIMIGVQFLITGFLGEMLSYQKRTPNINYREMQNNMTNDNRIAQWERFIVKRNVCEKFLWLLFGIVFILLLFNSAHTLYRLYTNFFVISNSIGEDGKVFFAQKFQQGQLPFANGEAPPYYPSFHGVLTHVSVGMIGRLFSCSTQGLYYVGRSISVLSLLVSLLLVIKIFLELRVKPVVIFAAVVLLFAPGVMHAFATSYRPDYWINAIYLLVYYLVCHKKSTRCEVIAIAMIVIAYLIKPTGFIYMGALLLVLLFRQHWKKIFGYSILFAIFLSTTILLLQFYSGGLFLSSFAHGMNVTFSIQGALKFFIKHTILYLTLLPIFAVFSIKNEKMLYLLIFWLVSFSGSALTSLRAGVGLNYYLSTYYFTVIIITYWWKDLNFRAINTHAFPFVGFFLLWFIITMVFPTYAILKYIPNAAIATSLKFDNERANVAQWINRNGFVCFSDDSGLNILLEKPQVMYPILLKQFIQSQSLSQRHFVEPLKTKKYDFVILTSVKTQHVDHIPDYFFVELHKNYERSTVEFKTNYVFWKKKP